MDNQIQERTINRQSNTGKNNQKTIKFRREKSVQESSKVLGKKLLK